MLSPKERSGGRLARSPKYVPLEHPPVFGSANSCTELLRDDGTQVFKGGL
jgi:hypothetical protein